MIQSHPLFVQFRHRETQQVMWANEDSLAISSHASFHWLILTKGESDWFKSAIPLLFLPVRHRAVL